MRRFGAAPLPRWFSAARKGWTTAPAWCGSRTACEVYRTWGARPGGAAAPASSASPDRLARLPRDAAFGIFEMGMNHAGELSELTQMVLPDVALITNIGLAHLAFFTSPTRIADAKAEIFEGLNDQGAAVLPRDDRQYDRLAATANRLGVRYLITFGRHPEADLRLIKADCGSQTSRVTLELFGETLRYRLPVPGEHWVLNSLGETAARAFDNLKAGKGRGAQITVTLPARQGRPGGDIRIIDDSYNANPLSLRAGLKVLAGMTPQAGGRRVVLLGEMLELGEETPRHHAALKDPIVQAGVELALTCGAAMTDLDRQLPAALRGHHFADSQALAEAAVTLLRPGDIVLVKGSLGSQMARVVTALTALGRAADDSGSAETHRRIGEA